MLNLGVTCTDEETPKFVKLFQECTDIFSWSFEALKTYDLEIFQHTIPLVDEAIPIWKKPRSMNSSLKPLIKADLDKMEKASIIFPAQHSNWISNLVVFRKKN